MFKKIRPIVILLSMLVMSSYLLWDNRYIFNSEPILDNKNYTNVLNSIIQDKDTTRCKKFNKKDLEKKFIKMMNSKIFPYWYGTKWGFNGITETPNTGEIACGYFVTTTLRDIGVPLNRVKLAQCASEEMIRTLVSKENIHKYSNIDIGEFISKIKKHGNGIYIIGLDSHTGYILLSNSGDYFIHSSGNFPWQVVKENLSNSSTLKKSKYKVIGKISSDESFLKKWINNK